MEHRWCPDEYQDRLTVLGTNPYGEPIFRLAWGTTETYRGGGYWERDGFLGYRDIPVSLDPCWMILMWEPAEKYDAAEVFYYRNRDEATGLCDLGEYPYFGKYRLIQKLVSRELINGVLEVEHMELNSMMLDVLVPMVKAWQSLSKEEQIAFSREQHEWEMAQAGKELADQKAAYRPAFGLGSRVVQKKAEILEKNWNRIMHAAKYSQRGFRQETNEWQSQRH